MHPIYTQVTAAILAALEQGVRPWASRWSSLRPLRHDRTPYHGINTLMLWKAAAERDYANPCWMTYHQAQQLGGQVRAKERGTTVVYATHGTRTERDDAGNETEHAFSFLKCYSVFNCQQIDHLPERFALCRDIDDHLTLRLGKAQTFFAATGANVIHGGDRACYVPAADAIHLPHPIAFRDAEAYVATKAHEFIHWTGGESRLARNLSGRFGDASYAMEELIAELGAAFLCANLGVSATPREDHASYLATWIACLKTDARAIGTVAGMAQRACDYLASLQITEQNERIAA